MQVLSIIIYDVDFTVISETKDKGKTDVNATVTHMNKKAVTECNRGPRTCPNW